MTTADEPPFGDVGDEMSQPVSALGEVVYLPPEPETLVDLGGYRPDDERDPVWALADALTSVRRLFPQPGYPTRLRAIKLEELMGPLAWIHNPAERPPEAIAFEMTNEPAVFAATAAVMHTPSVLTMFRSYVDWVRKGVSARVDTAVQRHVEQAETLAGLAVLGMHGGPKLPYHGYEDDADYGRADIVDVGRLRARGSVAVLQPMPGYDESGPVLWPLIWPCLMRLRRSLREQWWQAQLDRTETLLEANYPGLLDRERANYAGTSVKPTLTQMRERGLAGEARFHGHMELTSAPKRLAIRLGLPA